MTEKQKQAIQVLLRLTAQKNITDEEHILLLDFIVNNGEHVITLPPIPNWYGDENKKSYIPPTTVLYGPPVNDVLCNLDNANKASNGNYEYPESSGIEMGT